MIKVNGQAINFEKGMTLLDALKAAGESPDVMTLVVVNGVLIPFGQPYRQPLTDGAEVKLLPIVSGG